MIQNLKNTFLSIYNGQSIPLNDIPQLPISEFSDIIRHTVPTKMHLANLFCTQEANSHRLYALLADTPNSKLYIAACPVDKEYPSLTPHCNQAHLFEREIFETHGIIPTNHPWLKPLRFPQKSFHHQNTIGTMDFFELTGPEIHEVAVGPIHAGVIEPGHFRFQCHGEKVYNLEISLGYQHRDIEQQLPKATDSQRIQLIQTASGDSTAGHTTAYCHILESLTNNQPPARAQAIRGIALELERIACHIGDLGAMAGDVGFQPTSAYCGRIRGNVLNMTAALCGNRFSRNLIQPGGVTYDLTSEAIQKLLIELQKVRSDAANAIEFLFETPSVLGRFEGTGKVSQTDAIAIGMVGPAARACGIKQDVRNAFAYGIYQYHHIPIATANTGDVLARAMIRWIETRRSFTFVEDMLQTLPATDIHTTLGPIQPNHLAVSLIEGWRGEICHTAITNDTGQIVTYKIKDPSFHNWLGLTTALRNEEISDFPICNKSFNLSYCGVDL